jgi:MoxR-like ATPase
VQDPRAKQPELYLRWNALGEAIRSSTRRVVLIDEIDKAPKDFPNDLLNEIDQMTFYVPALDKTFTSEQRPIVIITSNRERQLPDPFLRRCVFHRIDFPKTDQLKMILRERLGHLNLSEALLGAAIRRFEEVRALPAMDKKPATGELLAWLRVLTATGVTAEALERAALAELPSPGLLAKTEQDANRFRQPAV